MCLGWCSCSRTADLLPKWACPPASRPDEAGCILSWPDLLLSADRSLIGDTSTATTGFTGLPRAGRRCLVVTNPLILRNRRAKAPASALARCHRRRIEERAIRGRASAGSCEGLRVS